MADSPHVATSMLAASARRAADADSKSAEAYRAIKDLIVSLELPPAALLDEYEEPALDDAVKAELREYVDRRRKELGD